MDLVSMVFGVDNEFFGKTGKPIHMDENYFTSLYYKFINERQRLWRQKGPCVIPGCGNTCIASHTIPESFALKKISHKGEVFSPRYNSALKTYECKPLSTAQASVFPGFCPEHESWFSGFERKGDFDDPSIAIQNLRVIFRYHFLWSSLLEVFKLHHSRYKKEIEDYQRDKMDLLNAFLEKDITLLKVSDDILEHMERQIDAIGLAVAGIHNEDLYPFLATMNGDEDLVTVFGIRIDVELPLCLAGKSEFLGETGKYTVHLSIFPEPESTFCCFSLNKKSLDDFRKILEKYESDYDFLAFIESWMVHGTDYWYIHPLEWESYSGAKREQILTQLRSTDHFPDEELDFTIFDSARASLENKGGAEARM